jgi:hypothetical protein
VAGFFWPRGRAAGRADSDAGNPFGSVPAVDRGLLRDGLGPHAPAIRVTAWTDGERAELHKILPAEGQVVLEFDVADRPLARSVILAVQSDPIDLGAMLAYPGVAGVRERGSTIQVTLVLDEVLG